MVRNNRELAAIARSDQRCVLATVIHVEGSAYRKQWASMVIMEDGARVGMISCGCLEQDLVARAKEMFRGSRTFIYDMNAEDDMSWGRGAGCNGVVHVLLERVDTQLKSNFEMVKVYNDAGVAVTSVRRLDADRSVVDYYFVPSPPAFSDTSSNSETFGTLAVDESERVLSMLGREGKSKCGIRVIDGLPGEWFIQTYLPKRRLIIFGAGEDARPLCTFAAHAGFSVTVADWRSGMCDALHFPEAEMLAVGSPEMVCRQLVIGPNDSVVVMTHHFEYDREILTLLRRERPPQYVGVLGPRRRTARLLDSEVIPDWLSSPVGLPIGAEGPEEIAISIVADLIRTQSRHEPVADPIRSQSRHEPVADPIRSQSRLEPVADQIRSQSRLESVAGPIRTQSRLEPVAAPIRSGPRSEPVTDPIVGERQDGIFT